MSLNSSKLTCWSPLISASWKCQGGSWFNTCIQININNCKQQKQLQITCTISPSSSSVSSTPRRVSTNFISEVDTIPFPSCISRLLLISELIHSCFYFPFTFALFWRSSLELYLVKDSEGLFEVFWRFFLLFSLKKISVLLTCYLERCISRSVFYTSTSITLIIKPTNSPKSTEPEPSASAS